MENNEKTTSLFDDRAKEPEFGIDFDDMKLDSSEEKNTFEIARKTGSLPGNPLELAKMKYFGESALNFLKENLKKANELDIPEAQRATMLEEGQKIGIALLDAEAKIGELSKKITQATPEKDNLGKVFKGSKSKDPLKHEKLGLKYKKHLQDAQSIKNHPNIVQESIKEAIENDDIPTKTAVLNKIKYEKEKEYQKKAKQNRTESKLIMKLEEQSYLNTLERIIILLPKEPPKNWSGKFFALAKGYVNIIIKRLEVFNELQQKSIEKNKDPDSIF